MLLYPHTDCSNCNEQATWNISVPPLAHITASLKLNYSRSHLLEKLELAIILLQSQTNDWSSNKEANLASKVRKFTVERCWVRMSAQAQDSLIKAVGERCKAIVSVKHGHDWVEVEAIDTVFLHPPVNFTQEKQNICSLSNSFITTTSRTLSLIESDMETWQGVSLYIPLQIWEQITNHFIFTILEHPCAPSFVMSPLS